MIKKLLFNTNSPTDLHSNSESRNNVPQSLNEMINKKVFNTTKIAKRSADPPLYKYKPIPKNEYEIRNLVVTRLSEKL